MRFGSLNHLGARVHYRKQHTCSYIGFRVSHNKIVVDFARLIFVVAKKDKENQNKTK